MAESHRLENRYIPYFSEKLCDFDDILYAKADRIFDENYVTEAQNLKKIRCRRMLHREKIRF